MKKKKSEQELGHSIIQSYNLISHYDLFVNTKSFLFLLSIVIRDLCKTSNKKNEIKIK